MLVLGGVLAALVSAELLLRVNGYDHHDVDGTASSHEFDPELGLRGKPGFAARFVQPDLDVGVALDEREQGIARISHPHDFHWNRDGHRIAAVEIERFLRRM